MRSCHRSGKTQHIFCQFRCGRVQKNPQIRTKNPTFSACVGFSSRSGFFWGGGVTKGSVVKLRKKYVLKIFFAKFQNLVKNVYLLTLKSTLCCVAPQVGVRDSQSTPCCVAPRVGVRDSQSTLCCVASRVGVRDSQSKLCCVAPRVGLGTHNARFVAWFLELR